MLDKRDLQLLLVVRFRRCATPETARTLHPTIMSSQSGSE